MYLDNFHCLMLLHYVLPLNVRLLTAWSLSACAFFVPGRFLTAVLDAPVWKEKRIAKKSRWVLKSLNQWTTGEVGAWEPGHAAKSVENSENNEDSHTGVVTDAFYVQGNNYLQALFTEGNDFSRALF